MANQNPEQIARDNIDKQLITCGWIIQGIKQVNLNAGIGVAVKEYLTDVGPADYVLFVEGKPCGVIEAKREEEGHKENLVAQVSPDSKQIYGKGKYKIMLIDCGVKNNIIRCLLSYDTTVIRVPFDHNIAAEEYDGLFISNGPGDPELCKPVIQSLRHALNQNRPIFGICLGSQLMALATGASTYKLKYGHRSHNQPVRKVGTNKCYITSQNHGFAVDNSTLGKDWEPLFINVNDGTSEGIRHKSKPFFSTHFTHRFHG